MPHSKWKQWHMSDAGFLCRTVKKLQTHPDIKKIVMVSHFVPDAQLLKHDVHLDNYAQIRRTTGNSWLTQLPRGRSRKESRHMVFWTLS